MIKIKNLAWATVVSTVLIAILYDGNIDEARGSSRMRMHSGLRASYSAGAGYGAHGSQSQSEYYRDATEDISPDRPGVLTN